MQKFFFKNNECKQIKSEGHFRKINLIFIKLWKFTLSFWEKNGDKSPSKYKYSVLCSEQFQSKNARKNRKNLKLWMTYIFWKTFGAKRKCFFDVPAKKTKLQYLNKFVTRTAVTIIPTPFLDVREVLVMTSLISTMTLMRKYNSAISPRLSPSLFFPIEFSPTFTVLP